jgi:hypothetical protein
LNGGDGGLAQPFAILRGWNRGTVERMNERRLLWSHATDRVDWVTTFRAACAAASGHVRHSLPHVIDILIEEPRNSFIRDEIFVIL